MTIEDKIQYYVEALNCFEDTMEKYKFLLDQGKKSRPFPADTLPVPLQQSAAAIQQ